MSPGDSAGLQAMGPAVLTSDRALPTVCGDVVACR